MTYGQKMRSYSKDLFNLSLATEDIIQKIGEIELKMEVAHNELELEVAKTYFKEGSPDWL
jgi:hypothetical protein